MYSFYSISHYILINLLIIPWIISQTRHHNHKSKISHNFSLKSILISYIIDTTLSESCKTNLNFFLSRGFVPNTRIQYVFSSNKIDQLLFPNTFLSSSSNIKLVENNHHKNAVLMHHMKNIAPYINKTDIFFFFSCDTIGPYYFTNTTKPTLRWIESYLHKLVKNTRVVSSTISCEKSLHIQSYAMMMTKLVTLIAFPIWSHPYIKLIDAEIAFTSSILSHGLNIATLDARHAGRNFVDTIECDPQFHHVGNSTYANPLKCYRNQYGPLLNTPGCLGVHPCEVLFVKENQVQDIMVPTGRNMPRPYNNSFCPFEVGNPRPYWNILSLYQNISKYRSNEIYLSSKVSSSLVILVRAHGTFSLQLLSMLYFLESVASKNINMTIVVIPTDYGSYDILYDAIHRKFYITDMLTTNTTTSTSTSTSVSAATNVNKSKINVFVIDFPEWIYIAYGTYLSKICTPRWRYEMVASRLKLGHFVQRACTINSPLHYLLVDIALHHILQKCNGCNRLLVTNADNQYSPEFFKQIFSERYEIYDIVMTYFLDRGKLIQTKTKKNAVDLGTYMTKISLIRNSGVSFLSSLSSHPHAEEYHDADYWFLSRLVATNAKIEIIPDYFFHHI